MNELNEAPTVTVRTATVADAQTLLDIYAPYVTHSIITFEYTVPTVAEFAERIRETLTTYPYLVAEVGGRAVGYAYAHRFRTRAAYEWAVELSIYTTQEYHGVGRALYTRLEELLRKQNVTTAIAYVTTDNDASVAFHEHMGYRVTGTVPNCAYKAGKWAGIVSLTKELVPLTCPPKPLIPFPDLEKQEKTL